MQIADVPDLATKRQTSLDSDVKHRAEAEDFSYSAVKICCPCESSLLTDSMKQCIDPGCQVQQHVCCVIIPEKPMEGIPSLPAIFHCEMCRINRADPYVIFISCANLNYIFILQKKQWLFNLSLAVDMCIVLTPI